MKKLVGKMMDDATFKEMYSKRGHTVQREISRAEAVQAIGEDAVRIVERNHMLGVKTHYVARRPIMDRVVRYWPYALLVVVVALTIFLDIWMHRDVDAYVLRSVPTSTGYTYYMSDGGVVQYDHNASYSEVEHSYAESTEYIKQYNKENGTHY